MNKDSFKSDVKNSNWSVLYDRYKNAFMRFAFKNFAIEREIIEDIYQDSFVVLYEKMQQGQLPAMVSIQTYLFAIGKNKLLNHLRDNDRKIIPISDNIIPMDTEYESEEWRCKQEIVYRAVCEMQEPCNRILSLFYYDRKSMLEIASLFNYKNEQVAKNRKYLCISKLKEKLMRKLKEEDLI